MKILIICSKKFYKEIERIKKILEQRNIEVFLPNCYDNPKMEDQMKNLGLKNIKNLKQKCINKAKIL